MRRGEFENFLRAKEGGQWRLIVIAQIVFNGAYRNLDLVVFYAGEKMLKILAQSKIFMKFDRFSVAFTRNEKL